MLEQSFFPLEGIGLHVHEQKKKRWNVLLQPLLYSYLNVVSFETNEDSKHAGIIICIYFYLFIYISCIIQFHFMSLSKGKEINLSDIIYWCSKHSSLFISYILEIIGKGVSFIF
jgi:hypothetical protein